MADDKSKGRMATIKKYFNMTMQEAKKEILALSQEEREEIYQMILADQGEATEK